MPSLADLRRTWLLRMLGISNQNLSENDLLTLMQSQIKDTYVRAWDDPTGALATTHPRRTAGSSTLAFLTTGRLLLTAIWIPAGTVVTSISFWSGNVAAVTPTNQWFALYDKNLNKLAVTIDDTTNAWAANAEKNLAVAGGPYTVTTSDMYYLGEVMVAATVINNQGSSSQASLTSATPPNLCGLSTSALTDPSSAPAVAAAPNNANGTVYAVIK